MASHAPSHGCRFVHSRHHSGERFSVLELLFSPVSAYWSCFEIPSGTEGVVPYSGTGQVPSALLVAYPLSECSLQLRLAMQGDVGVLHCPGKDGFVDCGPIPWDLWAFRVCFDC